MPEHTSFFSYLLALFPALGPNLQRFGHTLSGKPLSAETAEPLVASLVVVLLLIGLALRVHKTLIRTEEAVLPEETLSLRNFFEIFLGFFYTLMKDIMGPVRAKRYFPIVATSSCFVLFANFLGMIPGLSSPTSSWNITLGTSLVMFVMFNYYGLKENGFGYIKHLAGPLPALSPLLFPLEVVALCLRPITLSIRLMLNIAVDHLLFSIALGMVPLFVPIPIMILGTLVSLVQVVVFCSLSSIYIALATEHEKAGHNP